MEPHRHDSDTGEVILAEVTAPDPGEAEARALAAAAEAQAAAQVEVARIEGDTAVQLAKVGRSTLEDEERIELEALRVEVGALRDQLAPPEPAPIELSAPEPVDDGPPADAPPEVEGSEPPAERKSKVGLGMW